MFCRGYLTKFSQYSFSSPFTLPFALIQYQYIIQIISKIPKNNLYILQFFIFLFEFINYSFLMCSLTFLLFLCNVLLYSILLSIAQIYLCSFSRYIIFIALDPNLGISYVFPLWIYFNGCLIEGPHLALHFFGLFYKVLWIG